MATFALAGALLLERLCKGLGIDDSCQEFQAVQDFCLQDWGKQEIPSRAGYPSSIGDDHSPFEYSVAFGTQQTELRLLVETQGEAPGAISNQHAALAFNGQLAQRFAANFERFDAIKDLFLPESPRPPFSLWHAVCLDPGHKHEFKVYLNPQVRGPKRANAIVAEALKRLGLSTARDVVESIASREGNCGVLNYFSLDLSSAPGARVKIYFQHTHASAQQLERTFLLSPTHRAGDIAEFCQALVGNEGPYTKKPVTSCFSFVQGVDGPTAATFHLPIAHYVESDLITTERAAKYLASKRLDAEGYVRMMHAFAMRPLQDAAGIQSYASFRRDVSGTRFTAYLSPELFCDANAHSSGLRLKAANVATGVGPGSSRSRAGAASD